MAKDPRQQSPSQPRRPAGKSPSSKNRPAGNGAVRPEKAGPLPGSTGKVAKPRVSPSPPDSSLPATKPFWQNLPLMGGGALLLVIVGGLIGWMFSDSTESEPASPVAVAESTSTTETPDSAGPQIPGVPHKPQQPVACRIYTAEPGFHVFIDGEPARDAEGKPLLTPCEVIVEAGNRLMSVARTGWRDSSQIVNLTKPQDLDFDLVFEPFGAESTLLSAPYLNAPLLKPIPLTAINDVGQFMDPFLSADGLSIWMAGSGSEGQGVYFATRSSQFADFGPPEMLALSRSSELAASPSMTQDSRLVAFAVPEKARVWGLMRASPLGTFDEKTPLKYNPRAARTWESAQISSDGRRLYWRERSEKRASSWMSSRKKLDEEFGRPKQIELPGGHPCLSQNGLRQYHYDGEKLLRFRRTQIDSEFFAPEEIAVFELPDFVPREDSRQIWVTEDEQWMFYCVDPHRNRQLALVHLSDGPSWGYLPRGKSIPPRPKPKESMPKPYEPTEPEPEPIPVAVDPRTLPLPYVAYTAELQKLLAARDFQAAESLIQAKIKSPELEADRRLLDWDLSDVAALQEFWSSVEESVKQLKMGDSIRVGPATIEFVRFENGTIFAKGKAVDVEKPLLELSGTDLVAIVDRIASKQDADAQLRIGIFMYYDSQGRSNSALGRLDLAGQAGSEFLERLAHRRLQMISQEFERENLSIALKLVDELVAFAPDSESAKLAQEYRQKAYTFVKWEQRGPRDWSPTEDGQFVAAPERATGSFLISPREYENFELTLEWTTQGATGQGGVYFRYSGNGRPSVEAFKIQLANDFGIPADNFCTGALFNVAPPIANKVRKAGDWNTLKMQVAGEQVRVTINGTKVLETAASDPDIPLKGYVALDGEIGGISYRKIMLIETPPGPLPSK